MKRKGKGLLFIILLIIVVGIGLLIYFNKDEENVIGDIINTFTEKEKDNDNRNGFYIYEDKLDKAVKVASSCTITSYKYYISVVNKNWYLYKDTCLGVYQLGSGKTEDLKINYDSESKKYSLKYEGNEYVKNDNLRSVVPVATFEVNGGQKVQLDGYKTLIKETMFDGYHYKIEREIVGAFGYMFVVEFKGGEYVLRIISRKSAETGDGIEEYVYKAKEVDDLPDITTMNSKLVILDKYNINGRNNTDLKLFTLHGGHEYSLKDVFPITLNGEKLSPESRYIYVNYDPAKKYYTLLISENENFCVEGSKENKLAYYEFKVEVDYYTYSFQTPSFVRSWYERDGCSHYNGLKEG